MFACLHGHGNLTALAFEFSPTVEQTAPDTVTLDAGGSNGCSASPRMWQRQWQSGFPRPG